MFQIQDGVLIRYNETPDSWSVSDKAFDDYSDLNSITIPENVTSIGNGAFRDCSNLISITIHENVTSIDAAAFYGCSSLISITIPKSVTSIGALAFAHCSSLTSIIIPEGVTSISSYAFVHCSNLTSIIIPVSVTSIDNGAFAHCSSLNSITIPKGVTSIGDQAFYNCSSLNSITIPESVISIGNGAFAHCSSLNSITIPEGVTSIGNGAFAHCSSLNSITIPESVTSIGKRAFEYCDSLNSITILGKVSCIDDGAFRGCGSLNSITIPEGVTSIGNQAFKDCNCLTSITIPESVTSIGKRAFEYCDSLNSITILGKVSCIDDGAFRGCSSLKSITIPESVKSIDNWAFSDCSSLTSITIPEGVTSIGEHAFNGCSSLNSLIIPSSMRYIGNDVFLGCNTELLKYVCRFPVVFNQFEPNTQEYGSVVSQFIAEKLAQLHAAQATNPEVVFEIVEPDEAKLCFYMIRNLIRQNNGALRNELLFLMNIPQVKALLHTAVNEGQSNELLQLALRIGNQEAASLLLNVPAVLALAQENSMYAGITEGHLNPQQLAKNSESSLTPLDARESKHLEMATAHYTPAIEALGGSAVVIEGLREDLKARYKDRPAMLVRDDQSELELPLDWLGEEGFATLLPTLTATEQQRAKQAYHVHPDHTALRYLSKPNYWMDEQASHVYVNDAQTERWSKFEEYSDLIAPMYLAAIDEKMPALNDYTTETRFEHFINELWHITRSHNWEGRNQVGEEYHNTNQGDKPSCYSEVKRRLFQGVWGHELFQLLTLDIINQELDGFIRAFFEQKISEINANTLQDACHRLFTVTAPKEKDGELLEKLNIPQQEQDEFIASMVTKYGEALEPAFLSHLHTRLQLNKENPFHTALFPTPVSLMELLEKKITVIPSTKVSTSPENSPDLGQSKLTLDERVKFWILGNKKASGAVKKLAKAQTSATLDGSIENGQPNEHFHLSWLKALTKAIKNIAPNTLSDYLKLHALALTDANLKLDKAVTPDIEKTIVQQVLVFLKEALNPELMQLKTNKEKSAITDLSDKISKASINSYTELHTTLMPLFDQAELKTTREYLQSLKQSINAIAYTPTLAVTASVTEKTKADTYLERLERIGERLKIRAEKAGFWKDKTMYQNKVKHFNTYIEQVKTLINNKKSLGIDNIENDIRALKTRMEQDPTIYSSTARFFKVEKNVTVIKEIKQATDEFFKP